MARSAWPTVLSGDTWTASQHNTYGRDNDLAYWVFTTAGDMAYATSSSALARLAIGAQGTILRSNGSAPTWFAKGSALSLLRTNSGATDIEWSRLYTFFPYTTNHKTNTSWDGDAKTAGTYTLAATDFDATLPSGVSALLMTVSAQWAATGRDVNIVPSGATGNCLLVRSHDTSLFFDNMGVVPLVSNNFDVRVTGDVAAVYIDVWGYFL